MSEEWGHSTEGQKLLMASPHITSLFKNYYVCIYIYIMKYRYHQCFFNYNNNNRSSLSLWRMLQSDIGSWKSCYLLANNRTKPHISCLFLIILCFEKYCVMQTCWDVSKLERAQINNRWNYLPTTQSTSIYLYSFIYNHYKFWCTMLAINLPL